MGFCSKIYAGFDTYLIRGADVEAPGDLRLCRRSTVAMAGVSILRYWTCGSKRAGVPSRSVDVERVCDEPPLV